MSLRTDSSPQRQNSTQVRIGGVRSGANTPSSTARTIPTTPTQPRPRVSEKPRTAGDLGKFDFISIGGTTEGIAAALEASSYGARVALVETFTCPKVVHAATFWLGLRSCLKQVMDGSDSVALSLDDLRSNLDVQKRRFDDMRTSVTRHKVTVLNGTMVVRPDTHTDQNCDSPSRSSPTTPAKSLRSLQKHGMQYTQVTGRSHPCDLRGHRGTWFGTVPPHLIMTNDDSCLQGILEDESGQAIGFCKSGNFLLSGGERHLSDDRPPFEGFHFCIHAENLLEHFDGAAKLDQKKLCIIGEGRRAAEFINFCEMAGGDVTWLVRSPHPLFRYGYEDIVFRELVDQTHKKGLSVVHQGISIGCVYEEGERGAEKVASTTPQSPSTTASLRSSAPNGPSLRGTSSPATSRLSRQSIDSPTKIRNSAMRRQSSNPSFRRSQDYQKDATGEAFTNGSAGPLPGELMDDRAGSDLVGSSVNTPLQWHRAEANGRASNGEGDGSRPKKFFVHTADSAGRPGCSLCFGPFDAVIIVDGQRANLPPAIEKLPGVQVATDGRVLVNGDGMVAQHVFAIGAVAALRRPGSEESHVSQPGIGGVRPEEQDLAAQGRWLAEVIFAGSRLDSAAGRVGTDTGAPIPIQTVGVSAVLSSPPMGIVGLSAQDARALFGREPKVQISRHEMSGGLSGNFMIGLVVVGPPPGQDATEPGRGSKVVGASVLVLHGGLPFLSGLLCFLGLAVRSQSSPEDFHSILSAYPMPS